MSDPSPTTTSTAPSSTPPTTPSTTTTATARPQVSTRRLLVLGILVSFFIAGVVSFYASKHPDGLVFVAGEKGFLHSAPAHPTHGSPFAGYATRGIENRRLSGGVAGVVGATLVFLLAGGLFLVVRRRGGSDAAGETSPAGSGEG
ncbi:cobalt/nickel transport system permease protein/cobalt/nickel transport protein [Phycicoccus badiiscoriae]|uniref:Cobalt/nickel transport system permease protein/cobalt/nickel transport protein n=1 Tax=Pedococcus badiiscoriae TaxID=642776 RepID=A0A852WGL3_9MICO|nr:PDGLE domain-containing protein [Pedococcus badiiscoriae]NYG07950.1 cobalt/nickel transport system permease protein/cobalt/nickel transport protein [Pedococcus badiiscoriae]